MDFPNPKQCRGCHTKKELVEFGEDKYRPDGKATRCLTCKRQASATYRASHLEKRRERDRLCKAAQRAADPEKAHALAQAWRDANPEKVQHYRRNDNIRHCVRYAENPEPTLLRQRQRREADPESYRLSHNKSARARRSANPEKFREQQNAWLAANPDKRQTYGRTRRALEKSAPINDLTHAQWVEIQVAQGHRCYYCGKRQKGHLTQDHITPLSKGGSHTLHNVIAACRSCNSRKGTRKPPVPVQPFLLTQAPSRKPKKAA